MHWPSLMLRMPQPGSPGRVDSRELIVGGSSLRAMSRLLRKISKPPEVAELGAKAGMRCNGWGAPGDVWEPAYWEDCGPMSKAEWLGRSLRDQVERWGSGVSGPSGWGSGGWLWSPVHGCWLAQVFVIEGSGGPGGSRPPRIRLQPAALTVWQWDRDILGDACSQELSGEDLVGMCEEMSAAALAAVERGLGGPFQAPGWARERLSALAERARLAKACAEPGREGGGRRL